MDETTQKRLQVLLAFLRVYHLWAQATHWNVSGPNFYSDHLLYQRLYTEVEPQVDGLAEQIMVIDRGIDFNAHQAFISRLTTHYLGQASYGPESNFRVVLALRKTIAGILSDSALPNGLQDYLQALDNLLSSHTYLLTQRQS